MRSNLSKRISEKLYGFRSLKFWEERYREGGNSGDGSYGRLAHFKAEVLNHFIDENKIQSIAELGCGDGNQLSLIAYRKYLGLDVSETVIRHCAEKFKMDSAKSFILYKPGIFFNSGFIQADLSISLDVVFHLVEEEIYNQYLTDLFSLSDKFVIIYSTNFDKKETTHILHRAFLTDIQNRFSGWTLLKKIPNIFPGNGLGESLSDFFFFIKR